MIWHQFLLRDCKKNRFAFGEELLHLPLTLDVGFLGIGSYTLDCSKIVKFFLYVDSSIITVQFPLSSRRILPDEQCHSRLSRL
jgi:hypothetical protein